MCSVSKIDAFKKHRKLRRSNLASCLGRLWPSEASTLKALREQTQTAAVPVDGLDAIANSIAEEDQFPVKEITVEILLNDTRQAAKRLSEISGTAAKVYPCTNMKTDHEHQASRIRRHSSGVASRGTQIRAPATSISKRLALAGTVVTATSAVFVASLRSRRSQMAKVLFGMPSAAQNARWVCPLARYRFKIAEISPRVRRFRVCRGKCAPPFEGGAHLTGIDRGTLPWDSLAAYDTMDQSVIISRKEDRLFRRDRNEDVGV